jgi:PHD/YefM family antitoxin component YafN of YafNO toxin-antitoxin module
MSLGADTIRETTYLLGASENAKRLRSSIAQLQSGKTITKEWTINESVSNQRNKKEK